MVWIILLLMSFLKTAVSEECKKTEIIVGRLGEELEFNFTFSNLIDEYNKFITERYGGKRIIENEIPIQDLDVYTEIRFKNKMDSTIEDIVYRNGNQTDSAGNRTKISMTNDAFVVKKTKLQKEDAGIYLLKFKFINIEQKALIITGKPTIKRRSLQNPVLKPEDNYTSTIQLECHSVSTSIGECPLSMYTVWYINGMRMTDVDPTLSQINVTVDHNGGNFTCLALDYLPCYQRLQTTTHYDAVLNIEECINIFESETFILQPEYPPIDVKLEPDQRKITVTKGEDLKVRCSAKCHPKCKIRWKKEFQVLRSSGSISITESVYGKELNIINISSSHEGFYFCLVNNSRVAVKKGFTLSVKETGNAVMVLVIVVGVVFVFAVFVTVINIAVIWYRKYRKKKNISDGNGSLEEHIYDSIPDLHQDEFSPQPSTDNNSRNGESGTFIDNNFRNSELIDIDIDSNSRNGVPGTSRDDNSSNGEPGISTDNNSTNGEQSINTYDVLEFNTSNNDNPDSKGGYTRLFKLHLRYPKWFRVLLRKKTAMFNDE